MMPLAWYEFKTGSWLRHVISNHSYGHGIDTGDVKGEGRTDIITPKGQLEARPTRAPANGSGIRTSISAPRVSSTSWTWTTMAAMIW